MYGDKAQISLLDELYQSVETLESATDRGASHITSMFVKPLVDRAQSLEIYLQWAKAELFERLLNPLKDESQYILDLSERIIAGLNLLIYLTYKERGLLRSQVLSAPVITEASYFNDTIRKRYIEALVHTVHSGLATLDEQEHKVSSDIADQSAVFADGMHEQIHMKRHQLSMLQTVLAQANAL